MTVEDFGLPVYFFGLGFRVGGLGLNVLVSEALSFRFGHVGMLQI